LLLAILTLVALPAVRVPIAVAIDEPDLLWHVGASAFNDKLYPTAADVLGQFVEHYAADRRAGQAWLLLGQSRFALGQFEPALEAFRRALAFDPPPGRPQEARFWEAEALFRVKRYAEARLAYDHVIRTDAASPLAPDAAYGLAWSELELKRFDAAIAAFRELLAVREWSDNPLIPQATFTLARTLVDLGRYAEAEPLLAPFATTYPAHKHAGDAQYLLGLTRLALGRTKQGIADLRTFIAAYPSHELVAAARQRITEAVQKSRDRSELSVEYQTLMAERATTAERLYTAGQLAGELGDQAQQEAAWKRLREEFPADPLAQQAAFALATAAYQRQQYQDAAALAADARKSADLAARAALLEGEAELRLKRWAEARQAFQAAMTTPGLDPAQRLRALAGSAIAAEEQREWAAALRLYGEIATDAADAAIARWARDATLALGRARLAQGDLELALAAFRQAQRYPPPAGRSQEAKYLEADVLVRLKRYGEARAAYDAVVKGDASSPFAPDAVYGLAWLDLEQKRLDLAVRSLRQLVEKWPDHPLAPEAAFALARTLIEMKRYDEVIPVLARFTTEHPAHERAPDALYLLGLARLQTGKTTEGIADLRAFAAGNPAHELAGAAREKVTEAVLALNDPRELAREYEALMDAPQPTADMLYTAGTIARQLGRARDQEAAWDRLRRDFPPNPLAQRAAWELARAAFDRQQYREAIALAREAVASEALAAEAQLLIGDSELRLRNHAAALAAFTSVADIPGVDQGLRSRALAGSAIAREEQQDWARALDLYEVVAAESPDAALGRWAREAVLTLGKARLAQGDLEAALEAFRRAARLTPSPGRPQEPKFWEAETLVRLKRYPEARTAYDAVVRGDASSPLAPDAVLGLAWLELDQKRLEPAILSLRQFVERWPDHLRAGDAAFDLGRTLVEVRRHDEAVDALAAFTTRYPLHEHAGDARHLLGWTRLQIGKTAEGIADLRNFVRTNPTHTNVPDARRSITAAVQKLGDREELAIEYQALMDGSPSPEALSDAGLIAGQMGRTGDQEAAWLRLRREFPEHALARRAALELASAAYERARYEEAVALATDASKADELRANAYLLVGESELKLKRFPAAVAAFDAVIAFPGVEQAPRHRALAGRALAHEEQQQYSEALKLYEEVSAESPDPGLKQWAKDRIAAVTSTQRRLAQRAALDEAVRLFERKRYGEAAAQARSVTQSEEAGVRFESLLLIGDAELKRRRYREALQAFEAAAIVAEIDGTLRYQAIARIGQTFEEQQRWAEALQRYEEVAADTSDPELRRWALERAAAVRAKQKAPTRKPPPKPADRS
jgi:TolA-binding protein